MGRVGIFTNQNNEAEDEAFYIQAHGAGGKNNVIIRAGGASRLTVTNDGNVGIGTTNPGANLDVKHPALTDAKQYLRNETVKLLSLCGQSSAQFGTETPHTLSFLVGNEIKQVISPTGNVGIGTTNPGSVLTINHVHPQIRFEDADGDPAHVTQVSSYDGTLYFDSDMANPANTEGRTSGKGFVFRTDANTSETPSGKELLVIRQDGKVGIGANEPDKQLHIEDVNENNPGIRLSTSDLNYVHDIRSNGDGLLLSADDTNNGGVGSDIRFSVSGSEHMRIKKNGNVGIGTANPSSNLTIKNTGQHGETGVHIWNTSDGLPGDTGMMGAYTSYGTKTNNEETAPDYSYYTGIDMTETGSPPSFKIGYKYYNWAKPGDSNDLVVITSGGNVGIGTDNPNSKLEIETTSQTSDTILNLSWQHYNATTGIEQRISWSLGDDATVWPDTVESAYIAGGKQGTYVIQQTRQSYLSFATENGMKQLKFGGSEPNYEPVERMRIDASGNVGIGTDNPTDKLEVKGGMKLDDAGDTAGIWFGDKSSGTPQAKGYIGGGTFAVNNGLPNDFGISASVGNRLLFGINGIEAMRIDSNGKCYANGSEIITTSNVTSYANSLVNYDVSNLNDVHETNLCGISAINKIHICDYIKDGKQVTGIVAEDIKNAIPNAVTELKEKVEVGSAIGNIVHGEDDSKLIVRANVKKCEFEKQPWPESYSFVETKSAETKDVTKLAVAQDQIIATLIKSVQELNEKVNILTTELQKNK